MRVNVDHDADTASDIRSVHATATFVSKVVVKNNEKATTKNNKKLCRRTARRADCQDLVNCRNKLHNESTTNRSNAS